jgi:hypothetical protein
VLINQGPGSVKVTGIAASGGGFTLQPVSLPAVLASGANLSLNATFAPTAAQSASGTITVTSDATDNPLSVGLSGQGTALTKLLSANPGQVNFGNVFLGKSNSVTVNLANMGNAAVTISGISGAGAGFSVAGTSTGTTIAPGQSANLSVTFAPSVAGAASDAIAVQSDAPSPVSIGLSGIGIVASAHSVALTWQSEDGAAGYNVYRQDPSGTGFVKINSAMVTAPNYEDLQIQGGATYSYVVTAVSADGIESPQSDPVSATIPSA